METQLQRLYLNPNDPGSFGGKEALYRSARAKGLNVSRKDVSNTLKKIDAYSLHKPVRKRFKRNATIVGNIDKQWQADLADVSHLAKHNQGYRYILTVIDCFSKYAWAIPLRKKDSKTLLAAFKELFAASHPRKPQRLQTDKGKEFFNKDVRDYLTKNGVEHFATHNVETKAAMVERFNRTLKNRMYRYFTAQNTHHYLDVLPKLLHAYNHSYHRTIGMRPADVTPEHVSAIWKRTYKDVQFVTEPKSKLKVNDVVRIPYTREAFDKGYKDNWIAEPFKVAGLVNRDRRVYKIKDTTDDVLEGTFYPEELQQVIDTPQEFYRVEKILKRRKTKEGKQEVLVKWKGWAPKYNSWISAEDIKRYGATE